MNADSKSTGLRNNSFSQNGKYTCYQMTVNLKQRNLLKSEDRFMILQVLPSLKSSKQSKYYNPDNADSQ